MHQNRYSMFLSSPAFHPTPLHKITPFPPFPPSPSHACVPQFPLTSFPHFPTQQTAGRSCEPTCVQCPPVSIDARLSQRSLRAPSGAATQQIGPPTRAPAGRGPTDAHHSRRVHSHHGHRAAKPPPGRQRTFSCQKRRTLRGSDGFAPTTPIRSSTAAAPCSFALSLKPTGGHAE